MDDVSFKNETSTFKISKKSVLLLAMRPLLKRVHQLMHLQINKCDKQKSSRRFMANKSAIVMHFIFKDKVSPHHTSQHIMQRECVEMASSLL